MTTVFRSIVGPDVTDLTLVSGLKAPYAQPNPPPTNTVPPTMRFGGGGVGAVLPNNSEFFVGDGFDVSANPETWTGAPTFTYLWQYIPGVFASPPTVNDPGWTNTAIVTQFLNNGAQVPGRWYRCRVTGTNAGGSVAQVTTQVFMSP